MMRANGVYAQSTPVPKYPTSMQLRDIYAQIDGAASLGLQKSNSYYSSFNTVDFNPLILVRYQDKLLMRASVDFALNDDGTTATGLDFINLNWFVNNNLTAGIGKFDSSIGQFVQNISPNWINRLPTAPLGFDANQAAPQSEIGMQFRGAVPLFSSAQINFSFAIINAPHGVVDQTNYSLSSIATDGFAAQTSNYAYGGRIGILPVPTVEFGISAQVGRLMLYDSSNTATVVESGRHYNVLGCDFVTKIKNFTLRAEAVQQGITAKHTSKYAPSAGYWRAVYAQGSYRFNTNNFEPVVRYGAYKANVSRIQTQMALGLNYWFTSTLVGKVAYAINNAQANTSNNANAMYLQFAFGF